jgi:hypothetical protein
VKLSEILDLWEQEKPINYGDLGNEAANHPKLHARYYRLYAGELSTLIDLEALRDQSYKVLCDYYHKGIKDHELANELGLVLDGEKSPEAVTYKADIEKLIKADKNWIKINKECRIQKEKVDLLNHIIKQYLKERSYGINSSITMLKFQNGQ